MSPNPKSTITAPENPSKPGTSEWFYDEIMRFIEPDLVTTVIEKHMEMYADETTDERVQRMKAYDTAFAVFDKVAAGYEQDFHRDMVLQKKQSREKAMTVEAGEKKSALKKIEEEMDDRTEN